MSTWDDKPNDYEHALATIDRLRARNAELIEVLEVARNWCLSSAPFDIVGYIDAAIAKAKE